MSQVLARLLVLIVLAAALGSACGKKGPLYLPDEAPREAKPAKQP
jgi:predicted small lipoprotein YifL